MKGEPAEPSSTKLINALAGLQAEGAVLFVGGSTYAVVPPLMSGSGTRVRRSGTTAQMTAWLDGFGRGRDLPERYDGGIRRDGWWSTGGAEQRLAKAKADVLEYRKLVVDPSLTDQLRIQVLAAMEHADLNFKELAERIGKSPQSVRDALSFSNPHPRIGTNTLFERMLGACGRRFAVSSVPADQNVWPLALPAAPPEPSGVTRMRALVIAVDARLVDGVAPSAANRARKAREFDVSVAGEEVVRPRETLLHWLQGVADGARCESAQIALTPR